MDLIHSLQAFRIEMQNVNKLDTLNIHGKSPYPLEEKIIKAIDKLITLMIKYEN